jgi:hypothetical protein
MMDMNLYALEKQVQSKLQDARAAGARAGLISSLRRERSGGSSVLAGIATMWESRHRLLRRVSAGASGA